MPRSKMIPPLPESNEPEYDRFKRFAKALLAVPKAEITPEDTLAKLEDQKRRVDAKIAKVRRILAQRKTSGPRRSSRS
ncbi:MAG TPA: hypothetical protein VFA33_15875 [Bryobacteraceae bacterium]|nr:hypothetical protein [Bryobacteraceae bacterium]